MPQCGCHFILLDPQNGKYFNLLNSEKQASRTKAIEIFPEISNKLSKKDINKADAILIASFFNNTYKLED